MHRLIRFLCVFLSLCLLTAAGVMVAATVRLERYARAAEESPPVIPDLRGIGEPSVLYAYDPEDRAAARGEGHPAADGYICPAGRCLYVPYSDFPEQLINAFLSIEDKRFFYHDGVDFLRLSHAGVNYLCGRGRSFGGSTVTQQLIKNLTGRDEYTLDRKFSEIFGALALEETADKTEILEAYLNIINLGGGCLGVGAAADRCFSKTVPELTLAECAALAAVPQNPSRYDPLTHPDENRARRELILSEMRRQGYITEAQRVEAVACGIRLDPRKAPDADKPRVTGWFADTVAADVIRDLQERLGYSSAQASALFYAGGLTVYTTVDEELQALVDAYYRDASHFPTGKRGQPQSALVLLDPRTGDILAVAGGVGQKQGSRIQSYATDTRRPAGSAIKPLSVFAPAVERGLISCASVREDEPVTTRHGTPWPHNADRLYRGRVTVSDALAHSLNTVSVRLLYEVGMRNSLDFLRERLHMDGLVAPADGTAGDLTVSSLALGQQSQGVTLRELTGAYTVLTDGVFHAPVSYRRVLDREGRVLLENRVGGEVCLRRETAALVTSMLEEVVSRGTASALTLPESGVAVAGKTGTTQNTCDRWFVGYTPRLLCGVWMGYDYPASLEDLGGNPCLGIFDAVMKRAEQVYRGAPAQREFTLPGDLIRVSYCRTTGLLPCPGCREDGKMAEGWFLRGTEPRTVCDCHGRKVGDPEPPDEIK